MLPVSLHLLDGNLARQRSWLKTSGFQRPVPLLGHGVHFLGLLTSVLNALLTFTHQPVVSRLLRPCRVRAYLTKVVILRLDLRRQCCNSTVATQRRANS